MSEAVLPCVKSLAQAGEAEVLLVRVAEPLRPAIYPYGVALLEPIVREARAEANGYVQHIAATLNDAGLACSCRCDRCTRCGECPLELRRNIWGGLDRNVHPRAKRAESLVIGQCR